MTYVAKNLPAWVRFRKRAPVREAYGPPTLLEAIIADTMRAGIGRLVENVTSRPSPLMGLISRRPLDCWKNTEAPRD